MVFIWLIFEKAWLPHLNGFLGQISVVRQLIGGRPLVVGRMEVVVIEAVFASVGHDGAMQGRIGGSS